jgi:prevent-host-death family protein
MGKLRFRNQRGERIEAMAMTATEAKKDFGRMLETVIRGGAVVVTRHAAPKAVLVSVEDFAALARGEEARLDSLSRRFDALLDSMQTHQARAAMKAAFIASPKELGKAAVEAARRRG